MAVIISSEGEGMPSLEKLRTLAFLFIPEDASFREARGWLIAANVRFPSEVITAICEVHLEDTVLEEWRMVEPKLSRRVGL